MNQEDIGKAIWTARKAAGLTQDDLVSAAALMGGKSIVSRFEHGTRKPSVDQLARIADALGTTIGALLTAPKPRKKGR